MITELRFQLALFGQFEDVTPTASVVQKFSDLCKRYKLLPGVAAEVEITPNGVNQFSGLRLTSTDESLVVEFRRNRMDIIFMNTNINVVDLYDYERFKSFVIDVLKNDSFEGHRYKRLGFIHQILIDGVDHTMVAKQFVSIPFYQDLKMRDDWSITWPAAKSIGDNFVNIHTTIQRAKRKIKKNSNNENFEGIEIIFDVNTFKENIDYKYRTDMVANLCDKLHEVEVEVRECVINIINK